MLCNLLGLWYGRDTRPAQMLNALVSIIWVVLLLVQEFQVEDVNIPLVVQSQIHVCIWLSVATVIFAIFGLATKNRSPNLQNVRAFTRSIEPSYYC